MSLEMPREHGMQLKTLECPRPVITAKVIVRPCHGTPVTQIHTDTIVHTSRHCTHYNTYRQTPCCTVKHYRHTESKIYNNFIFNVILMYKKLCKCRGTQRHATNMKYRTWKGLQ